MSYRRQLGHRPHAPSLLIHPQAKACESWEAAITDIDERIARTKSRLTHLKAILNLFIEQRAAGEPFPCKISEKEQP